ncbi:MAG: hypothetical protein ACUVXD_12800 [Thermodesulfobacteriota bacterium]
MRAVALAQRLAVMGVENAAVLLDEILRSMGKVQDLEIRLVQDALLDLEALRACLGSEFIDRVRRFSKAKGFQGVLDLFDDGGSFRSDPDGDLHVTSPEFKGVSLGVRRALARRPAMRWLEKLLQDQDPGVIRNLLSNPRLTEAEVLKVASRAPVSPRVLEEVARSQRWISRYKVKKALVLNPYTPLGVSLPLLGFLMTQDLLFVSRRDGLSPTLRCRALKLWEERRPRETDPGSNIPGLEI